MLLIALCEPTWQETLWDFLALPYDLPRVMLDRYGPVWMEGAASRGVSAAFCIVIYGALFCALVFPILAAVSKDTRRA